MGTAKSSPFYLEHFVVLSEHVVGAIANIATNRFITRAGNYPAAGAYAAGVTQSSTVNIGDRVTFTSMGIEIVEVGGAISAVDTPLQSTVAGKATPVTDPTTQKTVAYALDTATGSGLEYVRVRLV